MKIALILSSLLIWCLIGPSHAVTVIVDDGNNPATVPNTAGDAIAEVSETPTFNGAPNSSVNVTSGTLTLDTSQLGYVNIGGTIYMEFAIDVNESGNNAGATFDLTEFSVSQGSTTFWDLGSDTIEINATNDISGFNQGSGDIDFALYIPVSALTIADGDSITVDFNFTGLSAGADTFGSGSGDGTNFEFPTPIPEPSTSLLTLAGLLGICMRRRR